MNNKHQTDKAVVQGKENKEKKKEVSNRCCPSTKLETKQQILVTVFCMNVELGRDSFLV